MIKAAFYCHSAIPHALQQQVVNVNLIQFMSITIEQIDDKTEEASCW